MSATLAWTIVGALAAVVAVPTAIGIGYLTLRQGSRNAASPTPDDPAGDRTKGTAASTVLPPPVGRLPEHVRGRVDLLEALMKLIPAPDGLVHILAGLGGCGKSTIALEVARQARDSGFRVWWVSAVDPASVTGALLGLARQLGAPEGEIQEALAGRVDASDVLWRGLEVSESWVLMFDNADDLEALTSGHRQARDASGWLRPTHAGLVLVTSRIGDQRAWGRLAQVHEVASLDDGPGARVLADLAPQAGEEVDARALAQRLGGLPLALHQAGSYLRWPLAPEKTFDAYTRALTNRFGDLLGRGVDDRARVTSTWELSLGMLAAQGRTCARVLLRIVSCFADGAPVPSMLLNLTVLSSACGSRAAAEESLEALASVGLLNPADPGEGATGPRVTVHPLVAETIRYQAGAALADSRAVATELMSTAVESLGGAGPEDRGSWLMLLPHLQALLRLDVPASMSTLSILAASAASMTVVLREGGLYQASLEIADTAVQHTAGLGDDNKQFLALRQSRACTREYLGQATAAEEEFRQVLDARVRLLGSDDPDTLDTRHNYANVLVRLGRVAAAEEEFRQVLDARMRILGPNDRDTLNTRHDIAWAHEKIGRLTEAEAEYQEVLAVQLRALGPAHRDTLHLRNHIAKVLVKLSKPVEAEAEFRQIHGVQLQLLGPDHPDTLAARHGIANALARQGRAAEAEAEYREVLRARRPVLGHNHPDTLATQHGLLNALASQGKPAEAKQGTGSVDEI